MARVADLKLKHETITSGPMRKVESIGTVPEDSGARDWHIFVVHTKAGHASSDLRELNRRLRGRASVQSSSPGDE